jgi:HAD superfamily phosphatase (TIGR01668 family)
MKFYPKSYFKSVIDINIDFLLKNNIKGVLLDIDNTLLDHKNNIVQGLEKWVEEAKSKNIKFCILSNTNSKKKAEKMSKLLDIPYVYFAKKPLKFGFNKAKAILKIEDSKEIAVIGDQVMTDVWGANRSGMYSILVEPINENDIWVTKINRMFERRILKKYLKTNEKKD